MTNNKKIEPMYVTTVPKDATFVGTVSAEDAVPIDTAIEGSPENVWYNGFYDSVKKGLIRKAAQEYGVNHGEKLFLFEDQASVQFHIAGIKYCLSADVYKR